MNSRLLKLGSLLVAWTSGMVGCGSDDLANPTEGAIRVQTETSGGEPDPDGYSVVVDDEPAQRIGIRDELVIEDLRLGSHQVTLGGLAENCVTAEGTNPQSISVIGGDTVTVVFEVSCPGSDDGGGVLPSR
jgi:ABC-type histidine transport system ATPase subunit